MDHQDIILHHINCYTCGDNKFKNVITRWGEGEKTQYGLGWMCLTCKENRPQLIIPMDDPLPLKGLIELNIDSPKVNEMSKIQN